MILNHTDSIDVEALVRIRSGFAGKKALVETGQGLMLE